MSRPFNKEYLWYIDRQMDSDGNREEISFYDHLPFMGCVDYDHKRFVDSQLGDALISLLEPFLIFNDEDSEAVKAYWAQHGMKKEVFEKESKAPDWNKYCVFTPKEAYEDTERKFPLVIYVHGSRLGGTKIFCEESSGIAAMATKHRFICVLPDNNTTDGVMKVYEKVIQQYPVDMSRIYLCGFSNGATCSIDTGLKYPEYFAGIMSITGNTSGKLFNKEDEIRAKEFGLPLIAIGGSSEMVNKFPLCYFSVKRPDEIEIHKHNRHMSAEGKIEGLNAFLAANGLPTTDLEEVIRQVEASDNAILKKIGVNAPFTHVETWMETKHYMAEYRNEQGIPMVKIVVIEGLPHHPSPTAYDLAWEFWKRFKRDPESKKLIVLP